MQYWEIYLLLPLGPSECFMVLHRGGDIADVASDSLVVRWTEEYGFSVSHAQRRIVAAAAFPASKLVVCCTTLGRVFTTDGEMKEQARIASAVDGPVRHGFIMGMRAVGSSVLAFGMGRQLYGCTVGDLGKNWRRIDSDLLDTSDSVNVVRGLLSVDGNGPDDMLAVGLEGEIWRCVRGLWQALASPTNVSLHSVSMLSPTVYAACGQAGAVLRVSDERIEVVQNDSLQCDLHQIAKFRESVFVSTDEGVYKCLDSRTLDSWVPACEGHSRYFGFGTNSAAIWLFNSSSVVYSNDSIAWKCLALDPLWELIGRAD